MFSGKPRSDASPLGDVCPAYTRGTAVYRLALIHQIEAARCIIIVDTWRDGARRAQGDKSSEKARRRDSERERYGNTH